MNETTETKPAELASDSASSRAARGSAHPWRNAGLATAKLKEARKEAKRRYERKYYADTEMRRIDSNKRVYNWRARQASAPNEKLTR